MSGRTKNFEESHCLEELETETFSGLPATKSKLEGLREYGNRYLFIRLYFQIFIMCLYITDCKKRYSNIYMKAIKIIEHEYYTLFLCTVHT